MPAPLLLLLSGPNLNLLGERQPDTYGSETLDDLVLIARTKAGECGLDVEHRHSNAEADLVDAVHSARGRCAAIIVNAGALTHYGWSLHDALAAYDGVIIELHLSNPDAREPWRHTSVISPVAKGIISGFGSLGYALAVEAAAHLIGAQKEPK